MNIRIESCLAYRDARGDLVQFFTKQTLRDSDLSFGQVYLVTFETKGSIRGNHFHNSSSEMFCLIAGEVEMVFADVDSGDKKEFILKAQEHHFQRIFVGERIAHAIRSLSDFAVMVSFSSKEFVDQYEDKQQYILLS